MNTIRAEELVGSSESIDHLRQQVACYAKTRETVLICGERGTGKELVAHALHRRGPRRGGPLVVVDCAALSETVFESDLFGHERGSFTGAHKQKIGLLEDARGGTLFLDEISHLPLRLQGKLLRFLQERSIRRVGGRTALPIDAKIVAASNRDLAAMAGQGQFLPDLFDRLNVLRLDTPPLRLHLEDIPDLIEHYSMTNHCKGLFNKLPPDVLDSLSSHDWPGNVRELFNVLSRVALTATKGKVTGEDFKRAMGG